MYSNGGIIEKDIQVFGHTNNHPPMPYFLSKDGSSSWPDDEDPSSTADNMVEKQKEKRTNDGCQEDYTDAEE